MVFQITIEKKINFVSIETKYEESLKDLSYNKNIDVIIQKNNINPEIDFKYLSQQHLKDSNNYEYLKEALTNQYYKKLYNNKRRNNPFK